VIEEIRKLMLEVEKEETNNKRTWSKGEQEESHGGTNPKGKEASTLSVYA
jgi:hypothetical protein